MLIRDRSRKRPVELGPWPLEHLKRDKQLLSEEAARPAQAAEPAAPVENKLSEISTLYKTYFEPFREGEPWPEQAPVPQDTQRRSKDIKGACYYLDADQVGICTLPDTAWLQAGEHRHSHAIVLLNSAAHRVEPGNPAADWLSGAEHALASLRGLEIASCIAAYIRVLGFAARVHNPDDSQLDLQKLAVLAGLAQRTDNGLCNPFLGQNFSISAISTDYELHTDLPLATAAKLNPVHHWLGINGATSGREQRRRAKRASHLSRYPMEAVPTCEQPTTLILGDEIPRVPRRAEFFTRARFGDLGARAQREVQRFAFKHPLTVGMMGPLRALVPHQDGETASRKNPELANPGSNSQAIKSLAYHLGADLAGICEVPDYAWYSHDPKGREITPYHRYAVVMLIDQGYDTMEAASGDDWISGCQSMRGYLRGAEIAGLMAEFLRRQGYSARAQTNADSHVLQIPLVLLAGLGELSRIGELVLNPYVGPRFKSVVLTTDLPLSVDKPIDFGLQYFCSQCRKCARECPVKAISFGDKVMYNGYEIWKPDVERCTTYRVNNSRGSACGRCMKTCPLNKVMSADGALLLRAANFLGIRAPWLKPLLVPLAVYLDDALGFGKRNLHKRWWLDLEELGRKIRIPRASNERDLDPDADISGDKSPIAYYHASDMPTPAETQAYPVNHRQGVARADLLESVDQARQRRARGGARPAHYIARS